MDPDGQKPEGGRLRTGGGRRERPRRILTAEPGFPLVKNARFMILFTGILRISGGSGAIDAPGAGFSRNFCFASRGEPGFGRSHPNMSSLSGSSVPRRSYKRVVLKLSGEALRAVASRLDPVAILPDSALGDHGLIAAVRPLAVDLLTASGMAPADARAVLPRI